MSETNDSLAEEKELLKSVEHAPASKKFKTYSKLTGPGWLQGAITLGGGSLAGSLYLGVIGGTQLLWLQPLMMMFGILMLSVIGYVTLSTGEKPFHAINRHINPVLGWGWLIAAMLANLVWAMPQFSLGTAALQQNLGIFPDENSGKYLCVALLFIVATAVVWMYDSKGVKYFEIILKILVGIIVFSFFGVVAVMAGQLDWSAIFKGFIPDFSLLTQPADKFNEIISQSSDKEYWTNTILDSQRDRMVTAAATAVGINMTFLLPYSMLRKGWGKEHRGLASFDLGIGLFIPFFLATTCVVIASASQFHGKYDLGLLDGTKTTIMSVKLKDAYRKNITPRVASFLNVKDISKAEKNQKIHDEAINKAKKGLSRKRWEKKLDSNSTLGELGPWFTLINEKVSESDRQLAAMLVSRDAFQLAGSLEKLTGKKAVSQTIFGIGVVGMAVSTIIILMLINGFCLTEALGAKMGGVIHRTGAILPGITGALGFLFLWGNADAKFWLAVPTSVFGMVLLPIAYFTFFCMINSKELMGDALPKGGKRVALNLAMGLALLAATIGAAWSIWSKVKWVGVAAVGLFILLALGGHCYRKLNQKLDRIEDKLGRQV
jgi:Mn2+/Fe2+ NRAMP family transporter